MRPLKFFFFSFGNVVRSRAIVEGAALHEESNANKTAENLLKAKFRYLRVGFD